VLNIPVKFHWFPFSSRREICRINFWRKKERIIIIIIKITRNDMIWRIINVSQFQKLWQILIHKNKIYLETKFCILAAILDSKWSPYGEACLTPCKYPFPLKSFYFWIFSNLLWFYIGSHFEMVAILKILKTKTTTLSDDLFLCHVSKGSAVRS
jgi:hypothetical protein